MLAESEERKEHFGVYLKIERATEVLLVSKTRGPYAGTMDLPGGTPEFGESLIDAVVREAREELGCVIDPGLLSLEQALGFVFRAGPMVLYHKAVVYRYLGPTQSLPHDETRVSSDTQGLKWVKVDSADLSPLARMALKATQG